MATVYLYESSLNIIIIIEQIFTDRETNTVFNIQCNASAFSIWSTIVDTVVPIHPKSMSVCVL